MARPWGRAGVDVMAIEDGLGLKTICSTSSSSSSVLVVVESSIEGGVISKSNVMGGPRWLFLAGTGWAYVGGAFEAGEAAGGRGEPLVKVPKGVEVFDGENPFPFRISSMLHRGLVFRWAGSWCPGRVSSGDLTGVAFIVLDGL